MVETATLLRNKEFQAVDRKTLCRHCYDVAKQIEVSSDERSDGNNDENDETYAAYDEQEKKEDMLNESLNIFDVLPIKTHNMSKKSQASSNQEKLERSFEKQKMVAADILQVHSPEFQSGSSREVQSKAGYLDLLLFLIKEKLSITTMKNSEKIQLMMFLAPGSWPCKMITEYFNVSVYVIWEAWALVKEKGIISLPDTNRGRTISSKIQQYVELFYKDDEY